MTPNRSLISAARAFIHRSAHTSAVVIAPLAAVAVAHTAQAQVTFGVPSNSSGGSGPNGGVFFQSGFSASALPTNNGITGVIQAQSGDLFTSGGSFSGLTGSLFFGSGSITGTVNASTVIPIAYNFTLSPDGSISGISWSLHLGTSAGDQVVASGTGSGTISGLGSYTVPSTFTDGFYEPELDITYTSVNSFSDLGVDMTGAGRGVSINAVPEPSTYALIFGAGALGLVYFRRQRRNATA